MLPRFFCKCFFRWEFIFVRHYVRMWFTSSTIVGLDRYSRGASYSGTRGFKPIESLRGYTGCLYLAFLWGRALSGRGAREYRRVRRCPQSPGRAGRARGPSFWHLINRGGRLFRRETNGHDSVELYTVVFCFRVFIQNYKPQKKPTAPYTLYGTRQGIRTTSVAAGHKSQPAEQNRGPDTRSSQR